MKSAKRKKTKNLQKNPFNYHSDQSWTCTGCGKCCTMWDIPVTLEEKTRIEKLNIPGFDFKNEEFFIANKRFGNLFLIKKRDNKCVFLGDDGLCIIHKLHGEPVKALACRLYPFHILKWKDALPSVSFRFDCVAVSENHGKKISERSSEMKKFLTELEKSGKRSSAVYNKILKPELSALRIIADAYKEILFEQGIPMEVKLYYAIKLLDFHTDDLNKQDIMEPHSEFKDDAIAYIRENAENIAFVIADSEPVNKLINMIFNYILSGYARVDEEVQAKSFFSGRIFRAKSILKFIMGKGSLHDLGSDYPDTKGISALKTMTELQVDKDGIEILQRYMAVQLQSLHFCGNPGLNLTFEEGMRHLLLAYPMTIAAAALKAVSEKHSSITAMDISYAVRIIDHTFYHSPFFALRHVRKMIKWLTNEKNFPVILKLCSKPTKLE